VVSSEIVMRRSVLRIDFHGLPDLLKKEVVLTGGVISGSQQLGAFTGQPLRLGTAQLANGGWRIAKAQMQVARPEAVPRARLKTRQSERFLRSGRSEGLHQLSCRCGVAHVAGQQSLGIEIGGLGSPETRGG